MLYFILTSLEFNFNLLEQMYKIVKVCINAYSFFHAQGSNSLAQTCDHFIRTQ